MINVQDIFRFRARTVFVIYVVLDALFIGMGMGVPILNIMFGSVCGWYIVKRAQLETCDLARTLQRLLRYSILSSAVSFFGMLLVWGWSGSMLFDPKADFVQFGIPMILYEPRASFIAWLVLMIVISPFLQMLMMIFAGNLILLNASMATPSQGTLFAPRSNKPPDQKTVEVLDPPSRPTRKRSRSSTRHHFDPARKLELV